MALVFANMQIYNIFSIFITSVHSFFIFKKKSGIDKSTEWSTIPACPRLMCFSNRGSTRESNSSKILCLMFCVCFVICSVRTDFVVFRLGNLRFDGLCEE